MQVSMGQLFIGVLMWTIVMIMPSLISYFQTINPVVSLVLLTSLYPTILSHLARSGNFWISYKVIMFASLIAVAISLFLLYVLKVSNPTILSTVPVGVFILALTGFSTTFDMYNSNILSN